MSTPRAGNPRSHRDYVRDSRFGENMTKPSPVQLYICDWQRAYALRVTKALIEEIKSKILPLASSARQDAEEAMHSWLEMLRHDPDRSNGCDIDDPNAEQYEYMLWEDLMFARSQLIGISLTSVYHLWEQLTKRFVISELCKDGVTLEKKFHGWHFEQACDIFRAFGYDLRSKNYYPDLSRLHALSNVVKHGHGSSRSKLAEIWPNVVSEFRSEAVDFMQPVSDELNLRPKHFDQLSTAVVCFWEDIPERLVLAVAEDANNHEPSHSYLSGSGAALPAR